METEIRGQPLQSSSRIKYDPLSYEIFTEEFQKICKKKPRLDRLSFSQ